jgi:uncharacterized phiE125 gp8 family phage protein
MVTDRTVVFDSQVEDSLVITRSAAKLFCRVTNTVEDDQIDRYILEAKRRIEDKSSQCIFSTTYNLYDGSLKEWPIVYIPKAPLQSINAVYSLDEDRNQTLIDSADYTVWNDITVGNVFDDLIIGYIDFKSESVLPADFCKLQINFTAGYNDKNNDANLAVPDWVYNLAKQYVAYWYFERLGGVPKNMSIPSLDNLDNMALEHRHEFLRVG